MRTKDIPNASQDQIMHNILDVVTSLRDGHLTAHMIEFPGIAGEIAKVLNDHLSNMGRFRQEHHRLMEEVGVTGRLGGQMEVVPELSGVWKEMLVEVNRLGGNITGQFRDGANVVEDLLRGDLSSRMSATCIRGEFASFRENLNKLAERFEQASAQPVTV